MYRSYVFFACLRVILTLLPQTGYIHPDEFFQSLEVVADKTFEVEVSKPWEFNASFPIRSAVPPNIFIGLGFQALRLCNLLSSTWLGTSLLTSYCVLVFPRLVMCAASFLVDWCLYRVCLANNEKYKSRCTVLSASYVMLTYATRTFSNTVELVLFALLLYYTSESVIFSAINVRQREYINARYSKAETVVERAQFHKLRLYLEDDSIRSCLAIAGLVTLGVFNRPTFVAYACAPVFFWLYRGIGSKSVSVLHFHYRMIAFCVSLLPFVALFILIDSFYFGYLTWGEIGVFEVSIANFVVTPLNFVRYNADSSNLAKHGLHPRYLHALVNVPILFNVLGLLGYFGLVDLFSLLVNGKYQYLPSMRSVKGLMLSSILIPLAVLSIFPHQEPRFLIPIILPLVYLYGPQIYPEVQNTLVQAFVATKFEPRQKGRERNLWLWSWLAVNLVLCFFYGFVHQGGAVRLVDDVRREIGRARHSMSYHLVTSHTYSLPRSLFLQRRATKRYVPRVRLHLHEEGSKELEKVLAKIERIFESSCSETEDTASRSKLVKCRVYLIIPTSLSDELYYQYNKRRHNLVISGSGVIYPHLSVEALPFSGHCLNSHRQFLDFPVSSAIKFLRCFGLARYLFTVK